MQAKHHGSQNGHSYYDFRPVLVLYFIGMIKRVPGIISPVTPT